MSAGQNSHYIRARIISGMEWCGLKFDTAANQSQPMQGGRISTAVSKIETSVISFEEAHVMAQAAAGLLYGAQTTRE